MKKLMIICGLLFSAVTFANAQTGDRQMPTPEERAERNATQLTKKLNLTDDQKAQVKTIYLDQAASMTKAKAESNGDKAGMMAKMKALNEENNAKINALLNEDQKKAYAAWQAERKEKMKNRGGKGAGKGAPAEVKQ